MPIQIEIDACLILDNVKVFQKNVASIQTTLGNMGILTPVKPSNRERERILLYNGWMKLKLLY